MNLCSVYKLTVLSFMLGAVTVVLFALAVSTDFWLTTQEIIKFNMPAAPAEPSNLTLQARLTVWTGLWRLCMISDLAPSASCMAVNYEVESTGRGEQMTLTTMTIIAAARRSVALTVASLVLSVVAVIFIVVGNIKRDAKTLVGAVFFILSGLSLAVGMILYISAVNDEVGYRFSNSKKDGGFSYTYGWSFFTAGFGFLASETAAVVTITLFLKRNSKPEEMARIIPGLEDKLAKDPEQIHEHYLSPQLREDRRQLCQPARNEDRCFHLCRGAHSLSV